MEWEGTESAKEILIVKKRTRIVRSWEARATKKFKTR